MVANKVYSVEDFCRSVVDNEASAVALLEKFRETKADFGDAYWPDWCYLTPDIARAALGGDNAKGDDGFTRDRIYRFMAAVQWPQHKIVYRFDRALSAALTVQPFDPSIPTKIFDRFPQECIYVEKNTRKGVNGMKGFFAWIGWEPKLKTRQLHLLLVKPDGGTYYQAVPIHFKTVGDAMEVVVMCFREGLDLLVKDEKVDKPFAVECIGDYMNSIASECLSHLIYICSEGADVGAGSNGNGGLTTIKIGGNIGSDVRAVLKRDGLCAHARWRWFFLKRNDGSRSLVCKWVPPMPVSMRDVAAK